MDLKALCDKGIAVAKAVNNDSYITKKIRFMTQGNKSNESKFKEIIEICGQAQKPIPTEFLSSDKNFMESEEMNNCISSFLIGLNNGCFTK